MCVSMCMYVCYMCEHVSLCVCYACVWTCVCVYMCMCVSMYVRVYVYVWAHVCESMCLYVWVCVCVRVFTPVCMWRPEVDVRNHAHHSSPLCHWGRSLNQTQSLILWLAWLASLLWESHLDFENCHACSAFTWILGILTWVLLSRCRQLNPWAIFAVHAQISHKC